MEQRRKDPLIILAGPTGVGKSETAVLLAQKIGGEVVSADSMQVYRAMDIGSAKITKGEMCGVPHHLLDVADPTEAFDAARYQELAKKVLSEIYGRGHLPILCGGTGFYIQAVTRDIDFSEGDADPALREELLSYASANGNEALHEKLRQMDSEAADSIHPNNVKRVIRAIEYYQIVGESICRHNEREAAKPSPYNLLQFVLTDDREKLYRRIDARVDAMMEAGLLDEVQYLAAMGCRRDMVSMQGLGYKELLDYLDGKVDLAEAVRIIKRDSRHYAKRQETWFRREKDAIWLRRSDFENTEAVAAFMAKVARERFDLPCR